MSTLFTVPNAYITSQLLIFTSILFFLTLWTRCSYLCDRQLVQIYTIALNICQGETERDRQTDRETDRDTERYRETETDRQTERQTETQRDTESQRQRQTDRQSETETDRQTVRDRDRQTDTHRASGNTPNIHVLNLLKCRWSTPSILSVNLY